MPQHDQHSARDGVSQVQGSAEHCWDDLVQQRLPANLQAQARALGAFQRVRALPSAQALLRAILCYVLSLSSLKQLSGWSRLVGVSSKLLSAQAWHKRLQRCGPWLLWVCTALLDLCLTTTALPTGQRILLVDATFLNEMGATGDLWRLHCAYDLLEGELAWVPLSPTLFSGERAHPSDGKAPARFGVMKGQTVGQMRGSHRRWFVLALSQQKSEIEASQTEEAFVASIRPIKAAAMPMLPTSRA
jgi:hypothetical protein